MDEKTDLDDIRERVNKILAELDNKDKEIASLRQKNEELAIKLCQALLLGEKLPNTKAYVGVE